MNPEDLQPYHVEEGDVLVRDIMTPAVYTVREDAPVSSLARTMVSGRIHRLFVTRGGRVVGVVTSLDLLRILCEKGPLFDAKAASLDPPLRHPA